MAEGWGHALRRDAVVVDGPDAATYLQGQLSQDVAALSVGASAWSWLLAPAGKVDALVRVARTGEATFVVDTDAGAGEAVAARLARFLLRTRADLTPTNLEVVAVRGGPATGGRQLAALWRGQPAVDVEGDPGPRTMVEPAGWEVARITAGVPVMGAELTERTIPAETGLVPLTVSFTKGCYTGQELVARIDSRGNNVARHLRLLRSDAVLEPGADLVAGDRAVGTVTSVATTGDGSVALAYVGRAVEPGAEVDAAGTVATVEALAALELP